MKQNESIDPSLGIEYYHRKNLLKKIIPVSQLAFLIAISPTAILGLWHELIFASIAFLFVSLSRLLIAKGKEDIGLLIYLLAINISILSFASINGREALIHVYLVPIIAVGSLIQRKKWLHISHFSISIVFWLILEFYSFEAFSYLNKDPNSLSLIKSLHAVNNILIMIFLFVEINKVQNNFIDTITDTNKKLKESANINSVLIKEVHHRVKNNLQLISSIIFIKMNKIQKNKDTFNFTKEVNLQIQSIARLYERLITTDEDQKVDSKSYFSQLLNDIKLHLITDKKNVTIHQDIESIHLKADRLIHLGLIVNELVTNSIKHAYLENDKGAIRIIFKKEMNHLSLEVLDEGNGFDFAKTNNQSFGLKLVDRLAGELQGTFSVKANEGTHSIISIPH